MRLLVVLRASVLVFLLGGVLSGCSRDPYFKGDLAKNDILGIWEIHSVPKGVNSTQWKHARLEFLEGGYFRATDFPLVAEHLQKLNGRGSWQLENVSHEGTRVIWEITLAFEESRLHTRMKVMNDGDSLVLAVWYNLDTGESFLYSKDP